MNNKFNQIKQWINNNPQTDVNFFVDVVYSLETKDSPRKKLRRINSWFESNLLSTWQFNKKLNVYELKSESDLCSLHFSEHAKQRLKQRMVNFLLPKIRSIVLNKIRKEEFSDNETFLVVVELNKVSQGIVICVRCRDLLIESLRVVSVIGHQRTYFSKDKILNIKLAEKVK